VLRLAAEDLYYHGVRLVVANVVWGIGALLTAYALSRSLAGFVALVLMVPLTVGLMGMATALVRERSLVMSDFVSSMRARFWRLQALGVGQIGVVTVAAFDLILGLQLGGIIGLVLAVIAFYTGLAIWVLSLTVWPIVVDPERRNEPVRSGVRLGALLVLAHPLRMGLLAIVLAALTVASTILVAAMITFAAAYIALVAAHFVLPAADRLQGRPTLLED
jgi:uncharacterized membrane protein YesL